MICIIDSKTYYSRCEKMFRVVDYSVFVPAFMLDLRIPKARDMKQKELAAIAVLQSTGVDILEAALIAKSALEAGGARACEATALRALKRSKRIITLGAEALRQQERTVTFEKAVEAALEARKDQRTRTVYDFRYFTRRFMKRCKGLAARRVRSITPQECAGYIN